MNKPDSVARPRRSVLYLPANNQRAIEKSRTLPADCIVFDLEDAVAPQAKPVARDNLIAAFAKENFGARETIIRCNPIGTDEYQSDLATVACCQPDALLLPKVSTVQEIERLQEDASANRLPQSMSAWFMIESAQAIVNIHDLVNAGINGQPRLGCLVVGTNDIAKQTNVSTAGERQFLVPWLMQMVLAAKAAGIAVLDGVWNNFKDIDGFEQETKQAVDMGFDGKTLIHPTQIEPANRLLSPDPAMVAKARAIVRAFAMPENRNAGVINLDGEMVERLHLEQAQQLLAVHEHIQLAGSDQTG